MLCGYFALPVLHDLFIPMDSDKTLIQNTVRQTDYYWDLLQGGRVWQRVVSVEQRLLTPDLNIVSSCGSSCH